MSQHALQVSDLSFSYGGKQAVAGVSFDLDAGQILGLLGPNGAGKSTTIKMIIGQLKPASGTIGILGRSMPADRDRIQAHMGVCFEEKNLYAAMSAAENLKFFGRLFGLKSIDVDGLLDRVGLLDRRDDRVSSYSKGMRQRLMMARALVNTPDLLVLDEPTDGLDPVSAIAVREIVRAEAARGAAVLLTTHDMHEVDELSDRVACIKAGQALVIDTPENLKLQHGTREVSLRRRVGGSVTEEVYRMDDPAAAEKVATALGDPDLLTMHTREATLEDVFVAYAGRRLAG